jgi:hypothetical protein
MKCAADFTFSFNILTKKWYLLLEIEGKNHICITNWIDFSYAVVIIMIRRRCAWNGSDFLFALMMHSVGENMKIAKKK